MSAIAEEVLKVDGITHISDDLYKVPLSIIQLTAPGFAGVTDLEFRNPRHALDDGKLKAHGFDKVSMDELRESIRTEGLENPLICRVIQNGDSEPVIQLVAGERRKRCLDKLVKGNEDCYDPADGEFKAAKDVHKTVLCRVRLLDDEDSFKLAFGENDRAVGIGEGATLALIRHLRNCNASDEQLQRITGKSITWVRDTDTLLSLDDTTFAAVCNDEVNRTVALTLAKINDVEERLERLKNAQAYVQRRIEKVKIKVVKEVKEAEQEEEIASADMTLAEHMDEDVDAAQAVAAKAKRKAAAKRKKAEELEGKKLQVTSKDLRASATKEEDGVKPLTFKKIQKSWKEPIAALIRRKFKDEEGDVVEVDSEDVYFLKLICEKIEAGERDPMKLLRQHARNKANRACKK